MEMSYNDKGLEAYNEGRYLEAKKYFMKAFKKDPENTVIIENVITVHYELVKDGYIGYVSDAIKYAELGARKQVKDSNYFLGEIYDPMIENNVPKRYKDSEMAIEYYLKVIMDKNSDFVSNAYNNLGYTYGEIKNNAYVAACFCKVAVLMEPSEIVYKNNYYAFWKELTESEENRVKQLTSLEDVDNKLLQLINKDEAMQQESDVIPEVKYNTEQEMTNMAENPYDKLNKLVGLSSIKKDVQSMVNLVKMQKKRQIQGLKPIPISLHLVFSGNPGTGKTTIARILAEIYKEIGVLSKGQLVEVDRAELVAGYLGQTAIKTQEKIEEALGGILFIDEAHTLAKEGEDYGQEAIDTILKAMEDYREDFIVIVAGYSDLMKKFINSNPGLQSRFNKYIDFPDYSIDELTEIFLMMCKEYEYWLDQDAQRVMKEKIHEMVENKTSNFANARDIRNMFEKVITNQATRLANSGNCDISQIISDDFHIACEE